jgi:hypothetical protein
MLSKILKGALYDGFFNDEASQSHVNLERTECRDTQISCIDAKSLVEPPEACRPQEGLKFIAPKHPEILGRAVRRAPHGDLHSQRKILGVQSRLAGIREYTNLGRSRIQGAQLDWQVRRHTEVL